ncbi:MAG: monocarboxylate uptake permease MctP [Acidimicrobiales bacterium]
MVNVTELTIFVAFFAAVVVIGFLASRWHRARLDRLEEWGLGGRRFGTLITWFLLGGDLYTAYTFIAVPALVFGAGALGMFAVPYTIIVYPLIFMVMPKMWQVARNRGHVTAADFVKDRFDSRYLALAIAVTGIVATMPYVALQVFGVEVVLAQMGIPVEASLITAFVILAVFTYVSGIRAPALIAIVKDVMLLVTVIVAVIYIPVHLGGFTHVFAKVPLAKQNLPPALYSGYSTLALGSALALFLYPHAITGVFSSRSQGIIRRNAALLPIYSLMLGLIAMLGYMAIAAGVKPVKPFLANAAVPALFEKVFPAPFVGFAFAAIAIGALVPAAIMSIAAANLFSRNIWREFIRPASSEAEHARVAKIASLIVKLGALAFILGAPHYAITLQLAGGVWALQTLPAVFLALYVKWLDRWATLAGWLAGMALGTYMLVVLKFKGSLYPVPLGGAHPTLVYAGLAAVVVNLAVVLVGTAIARAAKVPAGRSIITDADYQLATGPSSEPDSTPVVA